MAAVLACRKSSRVDGYIDNLKGLPPAPIVATELLDLFGDPEADIIRVVETIRHDPALTAQLLRLCNSAFYAGDEPAADMFEVVTRLGFYQVYTVVVSMVASGSMSRGKGKGGMDIDELWRHSVRAAVAAGQFAKRVGESEAQSFTAGLLHDIGKLAFSVAEGRKYGDLIKMAKASGEPLSMVEMAVLGMDHAMLGARLLARWGLPERICTAVEEHNNPPTKLAAIIHLASCFAEQADISTDSPEALPDECAYALEKLGLTTADIPELKAEIIKQLDQVEGLSNACFDAGI